MKNTTQRRTRKQAVIRKIRRLAHEQNRIDTTPKHQRPKRNTNGQIAGASRSGGVSRDVRAIYLPPHKKLKGWQKDHRGRKVR